MTQAHFHLLLNHFPIWGTFFGIILLLIGLTKKSKTLQKTALATFFIVGLFTIPVYLTGEGAEHETEHLLGSSHDMLEEHEEWGLRSLIAVLVLGTVSLMYWFLLARNRYLDYLKPLWILFFASVLAFVMMAIAGNHGGKIRRPELRGEIITKQSHEQNHEFDED